MSGWTQDDIPRLNPERMVRMRDLLEAALVPTSLTIHDDSHRHAGHAGSRGGMGHFRVEIVSPVFAGQSRLARHRMVYAALGAMMQTDIHALAIEARAPGEGS